MSLKVVVTDIALTDILTGIKPFTGSPGNSQKILALSG
jgi:hypothetical protein